MKPVERFDPEGLKKPQGEWRPEGITRAAEIGTDNGSMAMNSPGFGFDTELSEGAFDRTGLRSVSGVEAKAQVGSVDLVMVAKASLRASERPCRVSGSDGIEVRCTCFLH
ncbi:MAG TPA: hypothetical protein VHZ74_16840 [Bryobacteraceae bacterium]|nr:hypothetical protein [Bryobacteraceae bacterium]